VPHFDTGDRRLGDAGSRRQRPLGETGTPAGPL
jgi:hypothetical protein